MKVNEKYLNFYYETIGEVPEPVIDPKKTALLIVDMQNQFVLRDSPEAEAFKAAGEWERWIPFHDRLDEIVMFKPLSKSDIRGIIDLLVKDINRRIEDKEISLTVTDRALDYIVEKAYEPKYGARPLRRMIQTQIEDMLAEEILSGKIKPGDDVEIRMVKKEIKTVVNSSK